MIYKGSLLLFLLCTLISIIRVQAQTVGTDRNCLRVQSDFSGATFQFRNSLNTSATVYGFLSFWIRLTLNDLNQPADHIITSQVQYNGRQRLWLETDSDSNGALFGTFYYALDSNRFSDFDTPFIDQKWNMVWFGFKNNTSILYSNINNNPKIGDIGNILIQPSIFYFISVSFTNKNSKFLNLGEIQFWRFSETEILSINDFYERYQGISFKYSSSFPSQLVDIMPTLSQGSSKGTWKGRLMNQDRMLNDGTQSWQDCTLQNQYCPPSYRYDISTQKCQACATPCYECSYLSASKCMNCLSGYQFSSYVCSNQDCIKGTYYNSTLNKCMTCNSPCNTCSSYTACKYCVYGYLYVEDGSNTCVTVAAGCPSNTYPDPNGLAICRGCPLECAACLNKTYCTSCIAGYFLSQGQCSQYTCLQGDYYNSSTGSCFSCPVNCANCDGFGTCNKCKSGFFLDTTANKCGTTCPNSYYSDSASGTCMLCQPDCTQCTGKNYTCTACSSTTFLFNQSCVSLCPILGYFHNTTSRVCQLCDSKCLMCVANSTDCPSCISPALLYQRSCVATCPAKTYAASNGICYPCHSQCQVCTSSLHTDCSACTAGNYLLGTSCLYTCPSPYYQDTSNSECSQCKFFCNSCTNKNNCYSCKAGFPQIPANCTGEYFYKSTSTRKLNLPINTNQMPSTYDINRTTVEIWFRADNATSSDLGVLIGMTPYKIRKTPSVASIHLSFKGGLIYCESLDAGLSVMTSTWQHFAFTINEAKTEIKCFLDGVQYSIGTNSALLIATSITTPTEITLAGTQDPKQAEVNFVGYIKEFRFWNVLRSPFDILNGRFYDVSSKASSLLAYWKLNEVNDGTVTIFKDLSLNGSTFNPSSIVPTETVQNSVEFKEVYLLICAEGKYASFDDSLGYYVCYDCNSMCKNCIGPTYKDCVECNNPYKLVQVNYTCEIVEDCQDGFYQDPDTGLCQSCNSSCKLCSGNPNFCSKCNAGYFREYQGTGCVATCPNGMYGNFERQICLLNPTVTLSNPANETIYLYGTFVDLIASYTLLNSEPNLTFTYGWNIIQEKGNIDITKDAFKTYYQTDITKVHLDNNVIQPYNYYYITFYVSGKSNYYRGFYTSATHYVYFGSPPKNGKCNVTPLIGISTITKFQFKQLNWVDQVDIDTLEFFYSMDDGNTYLPMISNEMSLSALNYTFLATYQRYTTVKIKCKATNVMGFSSQAVTSITLEKRSSSDAQVDLIALNPILYTDENSILQQMLQLKLITQYLGNIPLADSQQFDPKIGPSDCSKSLCNNMGACTFISYTKKYFCNCTDGAGGQNCTFANKTQIQVIQSKIFALASTYNTLLANYYDFEFLKILTTYKEQLNDDSFQIAIALLTQRVDKWRGSQDPDDLRTYLLIISNLIEYIEFDTIENNVTLSWGNSSTKLLQVRQNIQDTYYLFDRVRDNSLTQINMVSTNRQMISRMITFRQQILTQDSLITLSASNYTRTRERTMIKISPKVFQNVTLPVENYYILELIEYAVSPYWLINLQDIATNVFEASIYNLTTYSKASVQGLQNNIEFYFPYTDNQNLTDFMTTYNSLSPYKSVQNLKRQQMLNSSNMNCMYYDVANSNWSTQGCVLIGQDNTHIKCACNHLTAVATTFVTPGVASTTVPTSTNNNYTAADEEDFGEITKEDLQVPIDKYFKNLQELLQHKQPKITDFLFKPGLYVVIAFWAMYISSLIYYTGRDHKRRYDMTKSQNRDDLAEVKDDQIQCIDDVIKELIARDYAKKFETTTDTSQMKDEKAKLFKSKKYKYNEDLVQQNDKPFSGKQKKSKQNNKNHAKNMDTKEISVLNDESQDVSPNTRPNSGDQNVRENYTELRSYEQMTPDEQKEYKKRARKKVFGKVGSLDDRLRRMYKKVLGKYAQQNDRKMKFFYDALKTTLWMGLMATTSKIAPRHARLVLLYLYISLHLIITSIAYIFGYIDMLVDIIQEQMFTMAAASIITLMIPWVICVPVALIMRMPMSLRKQVEGIKTKKINKVFKEIDRQMGIRYAIGYFICYSSYLFMTVIVLFFNYFYPSDYCMNWLFLMVVIYFLDLIAFTFAFAGMQLLFTLLASKMHCFYHIWATFEKIRRIKNLRG